MMLVSVTARQPRKKNSGYKRQHKMERLRAAAREARAQEKAEAAFDKRMGRVTARVEAAFRGCEL